MREIIFENKESYCHISLFGAKLRERNPRSHFAYDLKAERDFLRIFVVMSLMFKLLYQFISYYLYH